MSDRSVDKALEEMSSQLRGSQLLREEVDRYSYSYDASGMEFIPDAIVRPSNVEEVSLVLEIANRYGVPITPRGSGTSLVGGPLPVTGGIVLDMQAMNRVIERDENLGVVRAEAGITVREINRLIRDMFLPINPDGVGLSTLGGLIAENAASPLSAKYGQMGAHVLGLEVVLPDGRVVSLEQPGPPSKRNAIELIVGSEGILGVIASALVRLRYRPESRVSYYMELNDVSDSLLIEDSLERAGIEVSGFEVYHNYKELMEGKDFTGVEAIGFLEISGSPECIERWRSRVHEVLSEIAIEHNEVEGSEVDRVWEGREKIYRVAGSKKVSIKVVSMLSYKHLIRDIVQEIDRTSARMKIPSVTVIDPPLGWVTAIFLYNARDPKEVERTEKASLNLIESASSLGASLGFGTGVGVHKINESFDEGYFHMIRTLKQMLDPKGIMNPGKLL